MQKTAVLAGATGLVGTELLPLLCAAPEYARVIALVRKPIGFSHAKLHALQLDFSVLDVALARVAIEPGTPLDVFCCLGTTIKAAGSEAAFRRVDFDYVLSLARWAQQQHARRFIVVSALGADATSRVFYNRTKGEMERAVRALDLPVTVLHPSLLDGDRNEFRFGERLALTVTRPLRWLLPQSVRAVHAKDVAASMLNAARAETPVELVLSERMHGAAARVQR